MGPRRILLACAVAAVVVAPSCSGDADNSNPTTTASTRPGTTAAPVTEPTDTVAPPVTEPSTTASVAPDDDRISVAVYWTRPYGQARPIDIPAYRDPPGGPYPYVLYGSVTNTGEAFDGEIEVAWATGGSTIHTTSVRLLDPQGDQLASLPVAGTADLLVVVEDEAVASQLVDAVASFEVIA